MSLFADMERYALENRIPIMVSDRLAYLQNAVAETQPKSILEIGTAIGYSGLKMLEMTKDGTLTTIELDEDRYDLAKANFAAAGKSGRVTQWLGDAEEIVRLASGKYDFILLDGPKGAYGKMLPYLIELLEVGGVLFADNILFKGKTLATGEIPHKNRTIVVSLRSFLNGVNNDDRLQSKLYECGDGIVISKRIK